MKFNLKMMAVAAAMAAAGSASAAVVGQGAGNSSMVVWAVDTATNNWYARDLGYTLNTFLPDSVTTLANDGGATGTRTPEAGLSLSNAGDSTWTTWYNAVTLKSTIKWSVFAGDGAGIAGGASGMQRLLVAVDPASTNAPNNGTIRNGNGSSVGVSGMLSQAGSWADGASVTGTGADTSVTFTANGIGNAASRSALDANANLYYYVTTAFSLSNGTAATATGFSNSLYTAAVKLASNGNWTYTLDAATQAPSAVPVPAAAWLFGSGLLSFGAFVRRRTAK